MAFKDARGERGLYQAQVAHAGQISPHFIRVTLTGEDLTRLPHRGFDHWFRLFLPRVPGQKDLSRLPQQFGLAGYLKFRTSGLADKLAVRNYTVREHRPESGEIDIDFVAHGDTGIGAVWARRAKPGDTVALIDQGCGFSLFSDTAHYLLVGDESAQPAILGILRDLPREARGTAWIELPEPADAQEAEAPVGFEVRRIFRQMDDAAPPVLPGTAALAALREHQLERAASVTAYVVGERTLATQGSRHLLAAGVPKARIQFTGYWRAGAS
ncbi:MAG: siderophore-interacting protein [Bifidobacteriaceae bacterium]|jgi:NADPH-dependent ferric siderophore reductase|nr:siderophore-interacting protein [Bifidobacteriaceae bacterium]